MTTREPDDSSLSMSISFDPRNFLWDMALDLKLVIGFVIVTLAFIYVPFINETIIRSVLGLVVVLFIPGYSLISALFPDTNIIDGLERAVLSFGLSFAISPLVALGLNFTPWGIRLDPIVMCLTILTLACVLVANKRRHDVAENERFSVDFVKLYGQIKSEALKGDKTQLDKVLTVILFVSIVLSIAIVAYVTVTPNQGQTFTEFYILGSDGLAYYYPTNFTLGIPQPIIVGVVNNEYRTMNYDLVVDFNNSINSPPLYSGQFTLANNQTWEKTISLQPDQTGNNMEMEFLLYANGNMTAPYRELHIWVNVTASS
jgi:uncharacterized membrane protein